VTGERIRDKVGAPSGTGRWMGASCRNSMPYCGSDRLRLALVSASVHLVGLISDTHGLIRSEAVAALRHSDLIVHCGDIGDPAVLEALQNIAPVNAIRGNNDKGGWACNLPTDNVVELGGHRIYVLHNLSDLDLDPHAAGFSAVVSGHSHRAVVEKRGKILFVNPGALDRGASTCR
jgi:putative phosphoesterase